MTYQVTGPQGMRHKALGDPPDNDAAVRMWNGGQVPELECGAVLSKVVDIYPADGKGCGEPMCSKCFPGAAGFYVTVKDGSRTGYLLGPYGSKGEAESHVDRGKRLARQVNSWADFYAYGVTRVMMQPGRALPKGKLNDVELVTS